MGNTLWLLPLLFACGADSAADKGRAALDRHDLAQAEASFRTALQRDPAHTGALAGLGWTYQLAGQRPAAAAAFQRCVDLDPADVECTRGLASVAAADGRVGEARRLLDKAARIAPGDPHVESSAALLDLYSGELDAAADRYASLVARYPEDGEYCVGLAEARLRQGRTTDAIEASRRGLAASGVPIRHQAQLHLIAARALVAATAGREDPSRCAEVAGPLLAWLDSAAAEADLAAATGVELPDLGAVRRLIQRRRGVVQEGCPGLGVGAE